MGAVGETEKTEKITVNLGLVDLGQIDLLVQEGFYANRTDLIRTAIRAQLATHAEALHHTVARKTLVLGVQHYSRRDLEAVRDAGQRLEVRVLGLARIADDVPPQLPLAPIDTPEVLGAPPHAQRTPHRGDRPDQADPWRHHRRDWGQPRALRSRVDDAPPPPGRDLPEHGRGPGLQALCPQRV